MAAIDPVDVVIVTHNSAADIVDLLEGLAAACGTLAYRAVVVDNGSTDDTVAVLAGRTDVLVVPAENRGFGAGVNAGVAALAGAGPILVLNPDVRLDADAVPELVRVLTASGAGVVVPRLRHGDGRTAHSLRREPTVLRSTGLGDSRWARLSEVVNDPAAYDREHDVEWATGAVLLVARACYRRLGGFDEMFFMYSEETDFCLRAGDQAMPTRYAPGAGAVHIGGASGRSPDLYAMQVLNRIRLHRRRHRWSATLLLVGLTLGRETVHAARGNPDSRRAVAALLGRRPALLPWTGPLLLRSEPLEWGPS